MRSPSPLGAVLFDLDGTLIDTAPDFHACVNRLLSEENLPPLAYTAVRAQVSNGGSALIKLAFNLERGDDGFDQRLQRLLELYADHIADHSQLFEGMDNLLGWLEQLGCPWGVVTNKPERFAKPLLSALALNQRCAVLICPEQVSQTKPDPEGLLTACKQLARLPENTVYIGDHRRDIEAGRNGGLITATALFGYIEEDDNPQHWQADFEAHTPHDLQQWLASFRHNRDVSGTHHV